MSKHFKKHFERCRTVMNVTQTMVSLIVHINRAVREKIFRLTLWQKHEPLVTWTFRFEHRDTSPMITLVGNFGISRSDARVRTRNTKTDTSGKYMYSALETMMEDNKLPLTEESEFQIEYHTIFLALFGAFGQPTFWKEDEKTILRSNCPLKV